MLKANKVRPALMTCNVDVLIVPLHEQGTSSIEYVLMRVQGSVGFKRDFAMVGCA